MSGTVITLESLVNQKTGNTGVLTISGTPNGPVNLLAARTPPIASLNDPGSKQSVAPFTGTYPQYTVTFPTPGAWYVWASDNDGITPTPIGAYIGYSDDEALDEAGYALAARLEANRNLLDQILQTVYSGATFKQIAYGTQANIVAFPSLVVTNPSRNSQPYGTAYINRNDYRFTLAVLIAHQDEETQLRMAVSIAERIGKTILNQPAYRRLALPSTEVIVNCMAVRGEYTDFEIDNIGWCAAGTLVWSGWSLTQDAVIGSG